MSREGLLLCSHKLTIFPLTVLAVFFFLKGSCLDLFSQKLVMLFAFHEVRHFVLSELTGNFFPARLSTCFHVL